MAKGNEDDVPNLSEPPLVSGEDGSSSVVNVNGTADNEA